MANQFGESIQTGSMLLVLPVPFCRLDGRLKFESQACNGLNRWADNFSKVVVAAPVMPSELAQADKTIVWDDTAEVLNPRIDCVPLPWAYAPVTFLREYFRCRKLLAEKIRSSEYLQFAIGGLWGDWAAVAATEAKKLHRHFAIHTDRVESQVLRKLARGKSGPAAWKVLIAAELMDRYHRWIIANCSLGLWHGKECYAAYSPWCQNNHLIHDVHTKKSDTISSDELRDKIADANSTEELRLVYAGRMAEMKAPGEWIKAIAHARDRGVKFQAIWYGDGELRSQMEADIAALNLTGVVTLRGFVPDRKLLLQGLRSGHMMLFTHVTPESPRCLLESLICGTPLVGYDNEFAQDLTAQHGGGSYVPIHDWKALGDKIADLASQRALLQRLVMEAAQNGSRFNDDDLFQERSDLIKAIGSSGHRPQEVAS